MNDYESLQRQYKELQKDRKRLTKDNELLQKSYEGLETEHKVLANELNYYKKNGKLGANDTVETKEKNKQDQEPEVSKAMDKLRQQNKKLSEEKNNLTYQIDELRTRLSMMASHKLTAGNPDIADLSDAYRPTKIAELFRELYDNEWTSAFEELEQKVTDNDVEVIDILAEIIKNVDHFCSRAQLQQFVRLKDHAIQEIREPQYQVDESYQNVLKGESTDNISRAQEELADKLLKDFRKSLGTLTKTPLRKIFYKAHMSPFKWGSKTIRSSEDAKAFAGKTLDLVWMMKIQDPPMELTWCERGDRFNKNMYSYYTKRGDTVTQCIWPAVVLHKGGPLMSKGVVQGD